MVSLYEPYGDVYSIFVMVLFIVFVLLSHVVYWVRCRT